MPHDQMPETNTGGCIVQKFSSLVTLSQEEIALLDELEESPHAVNAGDSVAEPDTHQPPLLVLQKGWITSERVHEDGHRTIVRSHHPGDVVGFSELPFEASGYKSVAKSNAVICSFPRSSLRDLFATSPRLGGIFLAISLIEQAHHEDRASLAGRPNASAKLALFILQTLKRMQLVQGHSADQFHCPLTQTDIGDLVGMTNVHVSRTFKQLEDAEYISRQRQFIRVLEPAKLEDLAQYTDRYNAYDFSWLPLEDAA